MDDGDRHAALGIPAPGPCPAWCSGAHLGSYAGPGPEAQVYHSALSVGRAAVVRGEVVRLSLVWTERFEHCRWLPMRDRDVSVYLQVGGGAGGSVGAEATDLNLGGLAALARLLSPDVEDRVAQLRRLLGGAPADGPPAGSGDHAAGQGREWPGARGEA